MLEISIFPKAFYIGGVNVGVSVLMAWCVLAVLLVFLVVVRLRIRKFKQVPTGFQNLLEMAVDGLRGFARSHVGEQAADFVAPVTMTLMCYVFFTTVVELFGLPPATEDINCTFALGLCSFVSVNVAGVRFRGVRGRMRALANPIAVAAPIRVLTDMIAPCSMGIRLFANVMVGGVIMQLIYQVAPIIAPAAVASYFNVLHVGIQTFVFGLLSLIYTGEALE